MLQVRLSCCRNPDIVGGYWSEKQRPRARWANVPSLAEARKLCLTFIKEHELGAGNWSGGDIKHNGIVIARVSYNGRVWDAGSDFQIDITEDRELHATDW